MEVVENFTANLHLCRNPSYTWWTARDLPVNHRWSTDFGTKEFVTIAGPVRQAMWSQCQRAQEDTIGARLPEVSWHTFYSGGTWNCWARVKVGCAPRYCFPSTAWHYYKVTKRNNACLLLFLVALISQALLVKLCAVQHCKKKKNHVVIMKLLGGGAN